MRVFFTGAGGFTGSRLVPALLAAGHEVVALAGRSSAETPAATASAVPGLTIIRGDLAGDLQWPGRVEAVVHAAAVSPGPGIQVTAAEFIRNNADATRRLASWARGAGVRTFVYLSSVSVFGRIAGPVLDERAPRVDPDAYGASKWLGEVALQKQARGMASVSLRLPGVIGPGAVRNWLATMAAAASEGREIAYFHGDADYNNAVHVDDLCRFVEELLRRELHGHDMILLAANGAMKVRDMVTAIVSGLGGRSATREVPPSRPPFTISIERARARYGYRPMAMSELIARFVVECRERACASSAQPAPTRTAT